MYSSPILKSSDGRKITLEEWLDEFDLSKEHTAEEYDLYATALLKKDRRDRKDSKENFGVLLPDQLYKFKNREPSVNALEIDGTLTNLIQDGKEGVFKGDGQRIFWRQHPTSGRKVNDKEKRLEGSSYFKG